MNTWKKKRTGECITIPMLVEGDSYLREFHIEIEYRLRDQVAIHKMMAKLFQFLLETGKADEFYKWLEAKNLSVTILRKSKYDKKEKHE